MLDEAATLYLLENGGAQSAPLKQKKSSPYSGFREDLISSTPLRTRSRFDCCQCSLELSTVPRSR
jgi:hypothetical protein